MIQAVIMAGGKGTRLREITRDEIPKPMAPVAGKPILQWQIETLKKQGITDIILVIGHLGEKIRSYFGNGERCGVNIRYIGENEPLGTAGALALLPPFLRGECFFLVFGDVLFDIDLARMLRFHEEKHAEATLFVHPNSHPFDSDLVVLDEQARVQAFNSKHSVRTDWYQNCVNAGLYLLNREVCTLIPAGEKYDMEKQLLTGMIASGQAVYGYRSPEYIKDVGTVERIRLAEKELQSGLIAGRNLRLRQKAVFLDRDGTINRKNGLVYREDQFELEPDAAQAIAEINRSGYLAIVVTNQPVVARGLCSIDDVKRIHNKMETLLGKEGAYVDAIYFCPHHPDKGYPEENPAYKISCRCRKPDTGMLEEAAERFHIDLARSWVVGDTTVDIQTGVNAGTHTALVLTGDAGKDGKYKVQAELTAATLAKVIQLIKEREL